MKSFKDARALVRYAKMRQIPELEELYRLASECPEIDPDLLIATKHLLDSLRSALDYTAYGLFEAAMGPPQPSQKIFYPYARETQTAEDLINNLDHAMPKYRVARPDVVTVISSLQHYSSADFNWIPRFMRLSNARKHHNLGDQLPFVVYAMQISIGSDSLLVQNGPLIVSPGANIYIGSWQVPPGMYDHQNLPPLP